MEASHRSPARVLAPTALAVFAVVLLVILGSGGGSSPSSSKSTPSRAEQRDLQLRNQRAARRRVRTRTAAVSSVYIVRTGDTLGGIAQRTGRARHAAPGAEPRPRPAGARVGAEDQAQVVVRAGPRSRLAGLLVAALAACAAAAAGARAAGPRGARARGDPDRRPDRNRALYAKHAGAAAPGREHDQADDRAAGPEEHAARPDLLRGSVPGAGRGVDARAAGGRADVGARPDARAAAGERQRRRRHDRERRGGLATGLRGANERGGPPARAHRTRATPTRSASTSRATTRARATSRRLPAG